TGTAERGKSFARLGASAEDMAEAGDADDEQSEADPDTTVVVHGRRMPEQPAGEEHQQHGAEERQSAEEPADGVGGDERGGFGADEEPLHRGTGDREQHQQEREAVAALLLLERLGPERAEQSPGGMGEAEPRARGERRLLLLADILL